MRLRYVRLICFLLSVVLIHILFLEYIEQGIQRINCFQKDIAWYHFRNQTISEEFTHKLWQGSEEDITVFSELLAAYFATGQIHTNIEELQDAVIMAKKYRENDFNAQKEIIEAIYEVSEYFPVGKIENRDDAEISFFDTWNQSRSYGGERTHEGCDIMTSINHRGIYPIYSVCDGIVEKVGWLPLGGYRIGIRSETDIYFYYAHLAEYETNLKQGEYIEAGTLLGFVGDTGYSEVEGTTGNFDVHLHFGIYVEDENGEEVSVNSYPLLCYLWNYEYNEFRH